MSSFPSNDVFCFTALGFASTSFWSLPEIMALHQFELAAGMLSVLAGAIVLRELAVSGQDSALNSWIYMIAIRRADIDPRTTPVYRRYKIFRRFRWAAGICCLGLGAQLFVSLFVSVPFWLNESISDTLRLVFCITLGWIFRLTAGDFNGRYAYLAHAANPSDEPSDVDLVSILSDEITPGGGVWRTGMWLPPEPTQASAHHGRVKPRHRADSIDITLGEDLSLDD